MRSILATAAMVLTMGAAAHASEVGSAPIDLTQDKALCLFSNIGETSIIFSAAEIRNRHGTAIPLHHNDCGTLEPFKTCRIEVSLSGPETGFAHYCRAVVDDKTHLRGRFEVRYRFQVIATEDLK